MIYPEKIVLSVNESLKCYNMIICSLGFKTRLNCQRIVGCN